MVNKTITGGAAGSQGEVRIAVSCDEAGTETPQPDFVIPAGTPAGTVSMSYPNILAGSTCALTETANGATETATAVTVGSPQEVTISENGTATANVVNTYEYVPGALVVTKDIAGPAAGQQGQVSIGVSCVFERRHDHSRPVRDPGRPTRRHRLPHLRRHPGRLDMHRDRNRGRLHEHRLGGDRRRQPDSVPSPPGTKS